MLIGTQCTLKYLVVLLMSFRIVLPKTATPAIITTFSISFELIKDDETEGE